MKIKCEYCESFIDDSEDTCPNCGAVNINMKRVANGVPTTIEELKDYCVEQNLPISMMRFYIGENYKLPKAFGIYKDETSGEFIVYKNKADGTRAIRYQGTDEAYAVNEIYLKLQSEAQKQNARKIARMQSQSQSHYTERVSSQRYANQSTSNGGNANKQKSLSNKRVPKIFLIIIIIIFASNILEFFVFGAFNIIQAFLPDSDYTSSYSSDYDYDSDYYDYDYDSDYDYNYDYDSGSDYDDDWDYSYDDDWDTDWDSDWDDDWDSGSDWDSSYSDWDSDW